MPLEYHQTEMGLRVLVNFLSVGDGNVGCGKLRIMMKDMNHVCHDPDNFPLHVEASSSCVA